MAITPLQSNYFASFNNCIQSINRADIASVKIHCSIATKTHRSSFGALFQIDENNFLAQIPSKFQALVGDAKIASDWEEGCWHLYLQTNQKKFLWYRNAFLWSDSFEVEIQKEKTKNIFLDIFCRRASHLSKLQPDLTSLVIINVENSFAPPLEKQVIPIPKKVHTPLKWDEDESGEVIFKQTHVNKEEKRVRIDKHPDQLTSDEVEIIEDRMRPREWSEEGFLTNDQSLLAIFEQDKRTLSSYGITPERIANELDDILENHFARISIFKEKFRVVENGHRGSQPCPFSMDPAIECGEDQGSKIYTITNISTNEQLTFAALMPHLIRDHHFFQGGPYRLDPEKAIQFFDLEEKPRMNKKQRI